MTSDAQGTHTIGRRTFLQSAATGLSLVLPGLELLRPRGVHAAGNCDKLVLFHFPNGAHPEDWTTHPTGELTTVPPMLAPLQGRLGELVMVSGLSSAQTATCSAGTPHAVPVMSCMTGTGNLCGPTALASSRSVDFEAAELLGPTAIPSLYVRPYGTKSNISISGPGPQWVQPVRAPSVLFTQLFGDGDLSLEALEALQARRLSVLDTLVSEISDLEAKLGAADRQRLDFHLTTVRQLEAKAALGLTQCAMPDDTPTEDGSDPPDELLPQRTDDLMDLAMTALRCDITNVLVFSVGMSQGTPIYSFLDAGVPPHDAHQTSHMNAGETEEEQRMWWLETNRYHLSKFGRLLDLLSGSDGAEPILERSITVCFSEMGFGGDHSPYNLPCLVSGGGIEGGRHVRHPCGTAGAPYASWKTGPANVECTGDGFTSVADLWLTVLQALGSSAIAFGESASPLDGLW